MKVKDWLIHKLGGTTLEDAYRERYNLIQYKQSNVVTYKTELTINKDMLFIKDQIYDRLAFRMLDVVRENMEIEYIDIPEKDTIEYRGILRVVKVE